MVTALHSLTHPLTAAGDGSGGSAGELEPDGGGEEESLEGETQLADDDGIVIIHYRIAYFCTCETQLANENGVLIEMSNLQ